MYEAAGQLHDILSFFRINEDDIEKLRRIIQEAVDLSGRIRMMVREKEL